MSASTTASEKYPPSWEIPDFSVRGLRGRRTRYCVAVFVLNEGPRIIAQLGRMRDLAYLADIVVADGGSTDGALAEPRLVKNGIRALLVKRSAGGLSAQMRMAFAYALREGYEGVVTIDGNDKDDPEAIGSFLEALDEGYGHVQGSRFVAGGVEENTPALRLAGIRWVHAPLISLASGFRYTDTTNGFRAYARELLEDDRVAPFRDVFRNYELHYYLAIRAPRLGYETVELPVARRYPEGPAPTKISPLRGNLRVLATLLKACAHAYDPPRSSHDGN